MNQVTTRLAWPLAIVSGTLTAAGLIMLALTIDRPMSAIETAARHGWTTGNDPSRAPR